MSTDEKSTGRANLRVRFRDVARDRLVRIGEIVERLGVDGDDAGAIDVMMREIHTLKGEARLVGFDAVHDVAHATEDLLLQAREERGVRREKVHTSVFHGLDLCALLFDADETMDASAVDITPFLAEAKALRSAVATKSPASGPPDKRASVRPEEPSQPTDDAPAAQGPGERFTFRTESSIRIDHETLHELTDLAGTLMLEHDRSEQRLSEIAAQMRGFVEELDAVETTLGRMGHELGRGARPPALVELTSRARRWRGRRSDLRRLMTETSDHLFAFRLRLDELESQIRSLRLQPLESLFREYPRAVRELAAAEGKRVRLEVDGADVALEKEILKRLGEPLLHLVRNAIDHGIETPSAREEAGKSAIGVVALRARQRGPFVEIRVSDDGHGIDAMRVRRAAVRKGLMSQSMADSRTDEEVFPVLFEAGFSTMEHVTEVSGRGVGLDVVKANIEALGGSIAIETKATVGTTFVLTAPIAMVYTRALLVGCGEATYALPSEAIRRITDLDSQEVRTDEGIGAVSVDGEWMSLLDLRVLLGTPASRDRVERPSMVVVEHLDARAAVICDRLVGERPIVQRSFDAFLSRRRLLAGAAVLDSGALAILLDVGELVRLGRSGQSRVKSTTEGESSGPDAAPRTVRVLVVDDSEITRDLVASILRAGGYDVAEAVNGREALRSIEAHAPDVVVTDLEMPVMDGFELLVSIRQHQTVRGLPVIVFSTRGSESDTRKAAELGANAYLVKGRFEERDLLSLVQSLGGEALT